MFIHQTVRRNRSEFKIILNTYLYECARCFCSPSRPGTIFYDKYPIPLPQQTACTLHANVLHKRQRVFSCILHFLVLSHWLPMNYAVLDDFKTSYTILHHILHYLTLHLTLSYTASYTILHCILHPQLSLYKYVIGRRTRSNGHTECGHRGSGKYDAPTDFSASRWCAAALAQRIFPSAWHLVCKRCVRWFFIILHCVTV